MNVQTVPNSPAEVAEAVRDSSQESTLYCCAEWHLARFTTACAALIYPHALRITHTSGNYYCSIPQVAKFLDKDERTIATGFKELADYGFFERIRHDQGKAVNYHPISHQEWAEKHPGQCLVKLEMPWDGEGSPLGRALYSISGGQVKFFFPNVLKGLRKHGFSDDAIIQEWKDFLRSADGLSGDGVVGRFNAHLRAKRGMYSQS